MRTVDGYLHINENGKKKIAPRISTQSEGETELGHGTQVAQQNSNHTC
jgi:hypothetical protein